MHKLLESDRDLSEMRNANSPLEVMLERALTIGRGAGPEGHPMQDWMDSTAPEPMEAVAPFGAPEPSTVAKEFAAAVHKRAAARKKG